MIFSGIILALGPLLSRRVRLTPQSWPVPEPPYQAEPPPARARQAAR